jgi:saccharopepsin
MPMIGAMSLDCGLIETAPSITFQFGGKPFILNPVDYILKIKVSMIEYNCISGFVGMDIDMFIVGDVFLRKYYSVYDLGNHRVGFASSA